jgi:hypothetical protein
MNPQSNTANSRIHSAAPPVLLNPGASVELALALGACALTLVGAYLGFVYLLVAISVAVVFLAVRKASPAGQVAFLMVAIQLNIFSIEFGDRVFDYETFYTLRPATPAVAIMLVLLLWRLVNRNERLGDIPALKPMLLLDGAYFAATLLHPSSQFLFRGLIACALLTINVGIFVLFVRQLLPDPRLIERATRWLIALYAVYALAGILMVLVNLSGLDPHDYLVQVDTLGNWTMTSEGANTQIPRPWSFEPNTGSQMAAVCLLALTKAMQRDERHRGLLWLSAALIFIGVLLSFSRGAWVGLGAGMILLPFGARYAPRQGPNLRTSIWRTVAVLIGTVVGGYFLLVAFLPYLKDVLIDRLMTLTMWDQGTMFLRYQNYLILINDALASPIIGRGAAAYRGLLEAPFVPESFLVETFHSAGLLGLAAFVWLQIYFLRQGLRLLRAGRHLQLRWVMPFLISYAGYFVSIQTNPDGWGAFNWMFMALLVATLFQDQGGRAGASAPAAAALEQT